MCRGFFRFYRRKLRAGCVAFHCGGETIAWLVTGSKQLIQVSKLAIYAHLFQKNHNVTAPAGVILAHYGLKTPNMAA